MEYNKLVRDKIPEVIKADGKIPVTHVASSLEYRDKLRAKLLEEVNEFLKSDSIDEFIDVIEVIEAIREYKTLSVEQVNRMRNEKIKEKGAFKEKIILERVD